MLTKPSVLLALAALAVSTAAADDLTDLDRRISLELSAAAAIDVFNSFAALGDAESSRDPDLEGEVTIQLASVSVRPTTNAVREMLSCKWWIEDGAPRRLMVKTQETTSPEGR